MKPWFTVTTTSFYAIQYYTAEMWIRLLPAALHKSSDSSLSLSSTAFLYGYVSVPSSLVPTTAKSDKLSLDPGRIPRLLPLLLSHHTITACISSPVLSGVPVLHANVVAGCWCLQSASSCLTPVVRRELPLLHCTPSAWNLPFWDIKRVDVSFVG